MIHEKWKDYIFPAKGTSLVCLMGFLWLPHFTLPPQTHCFEATLPRGKALLLALTRKSSSPQREAAWISTPEKINREPKVMEVWIK